MKRKWLKKGGAVLLAVAMALTLFAGINITTLTAYAAPNTKPTSGYWTDAEGLKEFDLSSSTKIGKIKFGLSGADSRLWAICGKDGDDLALLSTTGFSTGKYGLTSEYSKSYFVEDLNKTDSQYLGTDYFSSGELGKMQPVTVKTEEPDTINGGNHTVSVENLKLYLPNSKTPQSGNKNETIIYVGKDNDIPIDLKTHMIPANGFQKILFWLRSPDEDKIDYAHVAYPDIDVNRRYVQILNYHYVTIMPALNLNLSSVLFASAADAASSDGFKANNTMTENNYTLRYKSSGSEQAVISASGDEVTITDASGKYLMVQNNTGVYSKSIASDAPQTIKASAVIMNGSALDDFNNCKVWIESMTDRIATAKMATNAAPSTYTYAVTVNKGTGDGSYEAGKTITITADAAPNGQEFDKWKVVSGGVTLASATSASTTFTMPANAVEVTATYKDKSASSTPSYRITDGAKSTWAKGSNAALTFKGDGALEDFISVKVDGKVIDKENYTVKAGSTVITLKASYLNTLTVGEHTLEMAWKDGSASTTFTVKAAASTEDTSSPETGDTGNISTWLILMMVSAGGIMLVCLDRRKKNYSK